MRTLFLKLMIAFSGVAMAASLAAGWAFRNTAYTEAGIAAFLLLLMLCGAWAYRQAAVAMDRLNRAAAQNEALLGLVRQGIKAGKQQADAMKALATGQDEVLRLQSEGAAEQQQLAKKLAAVEETARSASRQAGDSQELVLRAFRDISALQARSSQLLQSSNELLSKVLDETTGLETLLSPFVTTSEKLSRQILRETKSGQSTHDEQLVRVRESLEARLISAESVLLPFVTTSEKMSQKVLRAVTSGQTKLPSLLARTQYEMVQELEALEQLRRLFDVQEPGPLLGGFAMQPVSMLALVKEVLVRKPGLVVECGSGTSTLWIARALARNGKGRLVSLEHLEEYYEKTSRFMHQHGLEQWVDLRLAPLQEIDINGEPFQWYDPAAITDLADIDILSVDGPPGFIGPLARYPALPVLREKLAADALILVDDADREDEQAVMERWKVEIDGIWKAWKIAGRTQALAYRSSTAG